MVDNIIEHLSMITKSFYEYNFGQKLEPFMTYYTKFINFTIKPGFNLSLDNKSYILHFILFIIREFKSHAQSISSNGIKDLIQCLSQNNHNDVVNDFLQTYYEVFKVNFV